GASTRSRLRARWSPVAYIDADVRWPRRDKAPSPWSTLIEECSSNPLDSKIKVNVMRPVIAVAPWILPFVVAPSLAAQEVNQQGSPKDTVRKLAPVSIVATPSGRDQTRGANAIGKTDLKERAA